MEFGNVPSAYNHTLSTVQMVFCLFVQVAGSGTHTTALWISLACPCMNLATRPGLRGFQSPTPDVFRFKVKGRWMCFFKGVCSWKFHWKPPFAMCFWKVHAPSLCYSPQTPGMLGCPTVQTLSITQHSRQIGHYSEQKRKLAHSHPGLPDFTSLAKQWGLCHLK